FVCIHSDSSNSVEYYFFLTVHRTQKSILFPYTTLFRSGEEKNCELGNTNAHYYIEYEASNINIERLEESLNILIENHDALRMIVDRKSTRLNSSHVSISYAVFCLIIK